MPTDVQVTADELRSRTILRKDLVPDTAAFLDTKIPGSETKVNYPLIGPGVSENGEQVVPVDVPHGFNLGGAVMQSIFGALLTAGYASAAGQAITSSGTDVTSSVQGELTKSFSSAADAAQQYPAQADQIVAGAKAAFLQGDQWAYLAGIVAVLLGAVLVFARFPKRDDERRLLAGYAAADAAPARPD